MQKNEKWKKANSKNDRLKFKKTKNNNDSHQKIPKNQASSAISILTLVILLFALNSSSTQSYAGAFSYDSPVICAENCSASYEIFNNTPEYCDANPAECFNTIDGCIDGSEGDPKHGSYYEWIENITITSTNHTNFTGNDLVEIKVVFNSDYDRDEVTISYSNGSGWTVINDSTLPSVDDYVTQYYNITLQDIRGIHTVRAVIAYAGSTGMTCGYDYDPTYSDTDDVSFYVDSYYEENPPQVSNLTPYEGEEFELITPKDHLISATVIDDISADVVYANITWQGNEEILSLAKTINSNLWTGYFKNATTIGQYNITFYANDTNNNINNTQSTYFIVLKNANITVHSPINQRWHPDYTAEIDYSIDLNETITWTGYLLNQEPLIDVSDNFEVKNNISEYGYITNINATNISQSINLTQNMTLKSAKFLLKNAGNTANLILQIRNDSENTPGYGINSLISEIILINPNISSQDFEWIEFNLTDNPRLIANQKYWLVILQNGTDENHTQFAISNNTYAQGILFSNATKDLSFIMTDAARYKKTISLTQYSNNITFYANTTTSQVFSPTINFYVDIFGPSITNMIQYPASQNDLDPNKPIFINATITDEFEIAQTILQYKSQDSSVWQNESMTNTSSIHHANFTPAQEGNWSYRILAKDNLTNTQISPQINISVLYERNFSINKTQFNESMSIFLAQNASLGYFTIKNNGDLPTGYYITKSTDTILEIYLNGENNQTLTLQNNTQIQINITAQALEIAGQSKIKINIIPNDTDSNPKNMTLNSTIVSYVSGPFFLVEIIKNTPSISQGEIRASFEAKIINSGNETAYNLTIYWELPVGFGVRENQTINLSSLGVGEKYYFPIALTIPVDAAAGEYEIGVVAKNDITNNSDTSLMSITSDEIIVINNGGGSGGANTVTNSVTSFVEIGNPSLIISMPEVFEIKRGETGSFAISITNPESKNVSNITISAKTDAGVITQINLPIIENLGADSAINLTLNITLPLYMNSGKRPLSVNAQFLWNQKIVEIQKESALIIMDADLSHITSCIIESEKNAKELKGQGYNTQIIEKMIKDAKNLLSQKEYDSSLEKCEEIRQWHEQAQKTASMLNQTQPMFTGQNSYSESLNDGFEIAKTSFEQGEFLLAKERLNNVLKLSQIEQNTMSYRLKELKTAITKIWPYIIIALMLIILAASVLYSRFNINHLKRKLDRLNQEEIFIYELIAKAQKHRFSERIMGKILYDKHLSEYRNRLAAITQEKSDVKLKIILLKGESKENSIKTEIELITQSKKELQRGFYVKKSIDKNSYEKMNRVYDRMLSKLNEELQTK